MSGVIDPACGGCPANTHEPRRHFTVSLFHSPEQHARQACVHHEAQIAAESAESEIQVEQKTGFLG